METFEDLFNIVKTISEFLPKGENTLDLGNIKLEIDKKDNSIKITAVDEVSDSDLDLIREYKENIKLLDDELFIKATEKLSEDVNINYFNSLIEKTTLTSNELNEVKAIIERSNEIITELIEDEIDRLDSLLTRF